MHVCSVSIDADRLPQWVQWITLLPTGYESSIVSMSSLMLGFLHLFFILAILMGVGYRPFKLFRRERFMYFISICSRKPEVSYDSFVIHKNLYLL